jgi:putative flippase GtrA
MWVYAARPNGSKSALPAEAMPAECLSRAQVDVQPPHSFAPESRVMTVIDAPSPGAHQLPSQPTQPVRAVGPAVATDALAVEIVIPVYNEQDGLAASVHRLHAYLQASFPFTFGITIADNASTDGTWKIACQLEAELSGVRAVYLAQKGRGRALHAVWSTSEASVVAYMDVDLSTDLAALLPLVAPLLSGHSDVAIGTRLARSSRVVRGPKREVISRCYNAILRTALSAKFSDAQCGFKAIRSDRARELLPLVEDTGWFFDTELLVLAERSGMRIHEVPVDWTDDPDSRVDIVSTAMADLRGVIRLGSNLARGRLPLERHDNEMPDAGMTRQLLRFAGVGVLSTLAYLLLFLWLRSGMSATSANAISLLVTAVANTAINRRFTFGVRDRSSRMRHQLQGLVVFAIGLVVSTGALALLHTAAPNAGRVVELAALVVANLIATALRFLLFRAWVFRGTDSAAPHLVTATVTANTTSEEI